MGYRSELTAIVHISDLIPFKALLAETELDEYFNELETQGPLTVFVASGLKWYDGYADVDKINALFENSMYSVLLRLGDLPDDIEYYTANEDLEQLFDIRVSVDVDLDYYQHIDIPV